MADSFETKVNEAISQATRDDAGKLVLPEDVAKDEALSYAVRAEVRRRDTQSSFTQSQQKLKQVEAERDQYAAGWEQDFANSLPEDQQADLAELKASDPDAWRAKLGEIEQAQRQSFAERKAEIQKKASQETETQQREQLLSAYNETHPEHQINDEVLANDIPPRITKQLEEGKISFSEFLEKSGEYLSKGKVLNPGAKKESEPNLSSVPGGSSPSGDAAEQASKQAYSDEIF